MCSGDPGLSLVFLEARMDEASEKHPGSMGWVARAGGTHVRAHALTHPPSRVLSLCWISAEPTEAAPRVAVSTGAWLLKLRTSVCHWSASFSGRGVCGQGLPQASATLGPAAGSGQDWGFWPHGRRPSGPVVFLQGVQMPVQSSCGPTPCPLWL